jgi:protease-4
LRVAWLALFAVAVAALWDHRLTPLAGEKAHTALVEVDGVLDLGGELKADDVIQGLRDAFDADKAKGVILRINSPGGSPVQAAEIFDEIRRLRKLHPGKPLHAVVSDICASGGYYIAAAADRIYAHPSSLVGSIGVLMDGFGFTETMEKLGVERRLLTAGEHKGMLDPFSPLKAEERAHVQKMLDQVHAQFVSAVRDGRGKRLAESPDLFSGLIWSGEEAKKLGLVDDFGSADYVAREVIGAEDLVDYTLEPDYLERLARQIGMGAAKVLGFGSLRGRWRAE